MFIGNYKRSNVVKVDRVNPQSEIVLVTFTTLLSLMKTCKLQFFNMETQYIGLISKNNINIIFMHINFSLKMPI